MIASQFNLDHRLAELHRLGAELRRERAARTAAGPVRTHLATARPFVGTIPAGRARELAAR